MTFLKPNSIDAFLQLTSTTFHKLQLLNKELPFQSGHISERLSPLERFPIIKLDFPRFCIPNFRLANSGFGELLRYALQNLYRNNEFTQVLGSCQEFLIEDLVSNLQIDDLQIVPEREYTRNGSSYRGPDLIVVENKRMLIIESKALHVSLNSRLNHYSEHLLKDLEPVVKAIKEVEDNKLPDIVARHDVYGDINDNLVDFMKCAPIIIAVVGQGIVSMQEHITKLKEKHPEHLFNKMSNPHIVIDIFNFYRALETAKYNNIPLYDLFYKFWEVGNNLGAKSNSSDMFEGFKYDANNTYCSKIGDSIIEVIRENIPKS